MGEHVYVHRQYESLFVPKDWLERAHKDIGDFEYNCIRYTKNYGVRFDQAPKFDTAREPSPILSIQWYQNPQWTTETRKSESLWHHKWLWVKDDYKGFDIEESFQWSRVWSAALKEFKAIGSRRIWLEQLMEARLPLE